MLLLENFTNNMFLVFLYILLNSLLDQSQCILVSENFISTTYIFCNTLLSFLLFDIMLLSNTITGGYDDEEKAARAYDLAAIKYWGPTTHLNFPVSFCCGVDHIYLHY